MHNIPKDSNLNVEDVFRIILFITIFETFGATKPTVHWVYCFLGVKVVVAVPLCAVTSMHFMNILFINFFHINFYI
jgi:hypothetical protein